MSELPIALNWTIQTAVAFIATIAFGIIFHSPKSEYVFVGVTGAVGWLLYLVSGGLGAGVVMASFVGAVALTLLSRIFAVVRKMPVTEYLICGIFPLVPGAGIYYTGYYIFMGDNSQALSKGLETIKIAIAIAIGIGLALSLPRFLFSFWRKNSRKEQVNAAQDSDNK